MFEPKITLPAPDARALWVVFRDDNVLVRADADRAFALLTDLALPAPIAVGVLFGRPVFAASIDEHTAVEGALEVGLRPLGAQLDEHTFAAISLAAQLVYFARTHRYCARCASPLVAIDGSRARLCAPCKHEWYPRVSPCAIVLVHDGDRVLMTRHARFPPGMYGLIAGFVEPSESIEQCAAREAFEECGVRLRDVRYFGSQPWSFPHQLMLGFTAQYAGGELVVDHSELEDARWFRRDALPTLPPKISIARKLIDAWSGAG